VFDNYQTFNSFYCIAHGSFFLKFFLDFKSKHFNKIETKKLLRNLAYILLVTIVVIYNLKQTLCIFTQDNLYLKYDRDLKFRHKVSLALFIFASKI